MLILKQDCFDSISLSLSLRRSVRLLHASLTRSSEDELRTNCLPRTLVHFVIHESPRLEANVTSVWRSVPFGI